MKVDTLLEDAHVVDVVRQRVFSGWLGINGDRFSFVEEGTAPASIEATTRISLEGAFVQPGLIDTHMHIESSLVTPGRFAEAVLPWGTTTILQDPHEVGNVLGAQGVRFMLEASRDLPLQIYSAIPSCVPATSEALETPNAFLGPDEVMQLAADPGVVALGEMMDYQGLLREDPRLVAILRAGNRAGLSLEGHVPTLAGTDLSTYIAHGIRSDHTLMTPQKIGEELSKGLYVMLQEKSITPDVVQFVQSLADRSRVLLITDDVMPNRLVSGHLNRILELATAQGWNPLDALASATVRPATYLGLHDVGVIAPGHRADFTVSDDLNQFPPLEVYTGGVKAVENGRLLFSAPATTLPADVTGEGEIFREAEPLADSQFRVRTKTDDVQARVIKVNDANTFTELELRHVHLVDGTPSDRDIAVATVIPRSRLAEGKGDPLVLAFVTGLNIERGAFATSFSHDSHNLLVVGKSPEAMAKAANAVLEAGGGMAVATSETLLLPLPIAGLLSDAPIGQVAEQFELLESALIQMGMTHRNAILMLTILPLTVSPGFKISDKGIVDVENREILAPI